MAALWITATFTFVAAVFGTIGFGIAKMFGFRRPERQTRELGPAF